MKHITLKLPFNRGIISRLGMARVDLSEDRYFLSAEVQDNFMPRFLGSMMLRPGKKYKGATKGNDKAFNVPFIFSNDDTAWLEFTDTDMRVWVDETPVSRASVATAITNGSFATDLTGWTDDDEAGCTSSWNTGRMSLAGTNFKKAIRRQLVTVAGADQGDEHAVKIIVYRGTVEVRIGTTSANANYLEVTLSEGTHSLAFTPTGDFYVTLQASTQYATLIDSIEIEAAGDMVLPTPWVEQDLRLIRHEQSADVVYIWCGKYDGDDKISSAYQTYKIERRGTTSWSIVKYQPENGPWRPINITNINMTPSALSGDITITASAPFFKETNEGGLLKITSVGQKVELAANGADQFTDPIRVVGVDASRAFDITISGTFSATLTLQRSAEEPGDWVDVQNYTVSTTYNDNLDNEIMWYRIGIKTGNYTSGTANLALTYASGGLSGVVRITDVAGDMTASGIVLTRLGGTTASQNWYEGDWSERRGFPSAGAFDEGRLVHVGRGKVWGSESDAYESFDDEIEGDSRPYVRTIGRGPVDNIHWLLPSKRLVAGGEAAEWVIRSSSFDEVITQDNVNLKDPSNQGSAPVQAIKVDDTIMFVQKSGIRLFSTGYNYTNDEYKANDLTALVPELHQPGILRLAVQRQPDTRVHCVMGDGTVALMLFDSFDGSKGWIRVRTDGIIEDAFVLPGSTEDAVYYVVKRTINGSTVRYVERWATEAECSGGTYIYDGTSSTTIPNAAQIARDIELPFPDGTVVTARNSSGAKIGNYTVTNRKVTLGSAVTYATLTPALYKLADSFVEYNSTATTTLSAAHLEGETVVVWADGKYRGEFTVASGQITLPEAVERAVIGLKYRARYKTTRGALVGATSSSLGQPQIISHIGLIVIDTHASGLIYGPDFDVMDDMPLVEMGTGVDEDFIWLDYNEEYIEFDGSWSTDARVCLEAEAPKPCNIQALVIATRANEKVGRGNG